jgi:hypothetical protein
MESESNTSMENTDDIVEIVEDEEDLKWGTAATAPARRRFSGMEIPFGVIEPEVNEPVWSKKEEFNPMRKNSGKFTPAAEEPRSVLNTMNPVNPMRSSRKMSAVVASRTDISAATPGKVDGEGSSGKFSGSAGSRLFAQVSDSDTDPVALNEDAVPFSDKDKEEEHVGFMRDTHEFNPMRKNSGKFSAPVTPKTAAGSESSTNTVLKSNDEPLLVQLVGALQIMLLFIYVVGEIFVEIGKEVIGKK